MTELSVIAVAGYGDPLTAAQRATWEGLLVSRILEAHPFGEPTEPYIDRRTAWERAKAILDEYLNESDEPPWWEE